MLVGNFEKALIIGAFTASLGIAELALFAAQVVQRGKLLLALFQLFIVHIFLGRNEPVQKVQLHNGKQVAGHPINSHAHSHEPAEIQRKAYRKSHHAVFVGLALLGLQHIAGVLRHAQKPGRNTGQNGRKHQHAAQLAGHLSQVYMAEKGHVDAGVEHTGLDHLDQAHQQQDLHGHGNDGSKGIIFVALVNCIGLFGNAVFIAVVAGRDVVDLRLHFYHFNGILLYPDRYRQQYDLTDQCEQNNG